MRLTGHTMPATKRQAAVARITIFVCASEWVGDCYNQALTQFLETL